MISSEPLRYSTAPDRPPGADCASLALPDLRRRTGSRPPLIRTSRFACWYVRPTVWNIVIPFDGPHLALRDLEGVPAGRLTKQHHRGRQASRRWATARTVNGVLLVINGVQGAVVAARGCPDIVKGCFQRFAPAGADYRRTHVRHVRPPVPLAGHAPVRCPAEPRSSRGAGRVPRTGRSQPRGRRARSPILTHRAQHGAQSAPRTAGPRPAR
jgi:hypothetical protein